MKVKLKTGEIIEVVPNDDFCAAKWLNKETSEYIFDDEIEELTPALNGVWIKKVVTQEQLEKIRNADFVELRLETKDGEIGEKVVFYSTSDTK